MRVFWAIAAILACAQAITFAQENPAEAPAQLVREVVYNELHDHQLHGYWRYRIVQQAQKQTRVSEQIETADGPVLRLIAADGRPLNAATEHQETERLQHLLNSPDEQARQRQDYAADEKRIGRILALLPDAFLFEYENPENGAYRLRFRPNPSYPPHSIEARIFHAMQGELWVDARSKRLARLDGTLDENVDFGYGLLGRLYKGGWFRLVRTQVSSTDWKTAQLEVHMSGRALLFKTIAHETSETRSGFTPVMVRLSLAQGVSLLGGLPAQSARGAAPVAALPIGAMALDTQR